MRCGPFFMKGLPMIDLRETVLPNALEVDGEVYPIKTDFRTWIRFQADYDGGVVPYYIFDCKPPQGSFEAQAVQFMANPNSTPRGGGESGQRVVDFVDDGEYIVASFQQAYGIDLTDPELTMHWHRFKALFDGLPDDTKMGKIEGYRAWKESKDDHRAVMRKLREAWRLPEDGEAEAMDEARRIAEALYEIENGGE